ncbi:MAG: DUF4382 domain-containing protein [Gemmatimonadota bacterium]
MPAVRYTLLAMLTLTPLLGACNDSVTELAGNGQVRVMLTDAPADYLATAVVCISQVYLQGGDDEEGEEEAQGGRVVLWEKGEGPAQCFDLLELQGVSAEIAETEVPAGTYAQLRLIVESATVTLADGVTLSDGETIEVELQVPSGAQTGIKVNLLQPIQVEAETLVEVTVDADVNANFVLQGNPETPAGIQGVLFTPTLKEIESVPSEG